MLLAFGPRPHLRDDNAGSPPQAQPRCLKYDLSNLVSQIFAFSLYLSWSRAGVYPDARLAPIIPPDAPSRPDGDDAPLPLMRLMR
jgi:hypothetical protein